MSPASLIKFLSIARLSFSEENLLKALLKWAQHQSVEEGDDVGDKLRENVLIGLRHIAFASLSHDRIALFFEESVLKKVLSAEEQLAILMAVLRQNWNYLPNQIIPIRQNPRRYPFSIIPLSLEQCCAPEAVEYTGHAITSFPFEINCNAELIGIKFRWLDDLCYKFTLKEEAVGSNNVCIVNDTAQNVIFHRGKNFCKLNTAPSLRAGTVYHFTISHSCSEGHVDGLTKYKSPSDKILARSADGLKMTILESNISDLVDSLLFEKIK
jgi:hypothetical protein